MSYESIIKYRSTQKTFQYTYIKQPCHYWLHMTYCNRKTVQPHTSVLRWKVTNFVAHSRFKPLLQRSLELLQ